MVVSHEQQEFFARWGYLRFGSVYDDAELDRLRTSFADLRSAFDAAEPTDPLRRRAGAFNVTAGSGTTTPTLTKLFAVDDVFRAHAHHPVIAEVAATLLGTRQLRLMMDQVIEKEPGTSGFVHWHHDYASWQVQPAIQITCWLALDEVTAASGAMHVVPGSHLLGEFARVDLGTGRKSSPVDRREVIPADPAAAGHEVVALELAPGECSFHHALTWHATPPNTVGGRRRALVTRFMADGTRYRPMPGSKPAATDGVDPMDNDEWYPIVWPVP